MLQPRVHLALVPSSQAVDPSHGKDGFWEDLMLLKVGKLRLLGRVSPRHPLLPQTAPARPRSLALALVVYGGCR